MSTRVFLLEPLTRQHDLANLRKFGKIEILFNTHRDDELPSVFDTNSFMRALIGKLVCVDFRPEHDVFVLSGRATKVAVATAVLQRYIQSYETPYDLLRVLMYDGAAQEYKERAL